MDGSYRVSWIRAFVLMGVYHHSISVVTSESIGMWSLHAIIYLEFWNFPAVAGTSTAVIHIRCKMFSHITHPSDITHPFYVEWAEGAVNMGSGTAAIYSEGCLKPNNKLYALLGDLKSVPRGAVGPTLLAPCICTQPPKTLQSPFKRHLKSTASYND